MRRDSVAPVYTVYNNKGTYKYKHVNNCNKDSKQEFKENLQLSTEDILTFRSGEQISIMQCNYVCIRSVAFQYNIVVQIQLVLMAIVKFHLCNNV